MLSLFCSLFVYQNALSLVIFVYPLSIGFIGYWWVSHYSLATLLGKQRISERFEVDLIYIWCSIIQKKITLIKFMKILLLDEIRDSIRIDVGNLRRRFFAWLFVWSCMIIYDICARCYTIRQESVTDLIVWFSDLGIDFLEDWIYSPEPF